MIYDLHVHTNLSACADKSNSEIKDYLIQAQKQSLFAIGFTDHSWDKNAGKCNNWYSPQDFIRLETRKMAFNKIKTDIKVFFGAEGEFASYVLGITKDAYKYVDYIIVPHSHTHQTGFVTQKEDVATPAAHAEFLVNSFKKLCLHPNRDLYFGIAHPFLPVGQSVNQAAELIDLIGDKQLEECFGIAKEKNIFIEVNSGAFRNCDLKDIQNFYYSRVIRAAKKAGCSFFYGSDKHAVINYGEYDLFYELTKHLHKLGLSQEDFSSAIEELIKRR